MKKSLFQKKIKSTEICFGLSRETDEHSLAAFVQLFAAEDLLNTLIPRLDDAEIDETVGFLTRLMKKHLHENEYHGLFLKEEE